LRFSGLAVAAEAAKVSATTTTTPTMYCLIGEIVIILVIVTA
jgi:hypothetical protein